MRTPRDRFRLETTILYLCVMAFAAAAIYWNWFVTVDRFLFDGVITQAAPPLNEDIVIVGIDEASLDQYGRWPWNRDVQADLLDAIRINNPKAVLLDIVYSNTTTDVADQRLVESAAQVTDLSLPIIIDQFVRHAPPIEVMPFPELLAQADTLGHVHVQLDNDAIARSTYLYQGVGDSRWPHLTLAAAIALGNVDPSRYQCETSAGYSLAQQHCGLVYVPFVG